jgi:glycine/D-amino acid oxidase-like deaminating enzyme
MSPYPFCSSDFKAETYWWDSTPRPAPRQSELPESTDVLVIGSGYTGLHCALQTVQAGRETIVIDAEDLGWGCSSRNGGQISGEIKPGYPALSRRYGRDDALALLREARHALDWLGEFVAEQGLDCDYQQCGRYLAAHNPRQFRKLAAEARQQLPGLEQALQVVERRDQAREIDSDYYHGGLVISIATTITAVSSSNATAVSIRRSITRLCCNWWRPAAAGCSAIAPRSG